MGSGKINLTTLKLNHHAKPDASTAVGGQLEGTGPRLRLLYAPAFFLCSRPPPRPPARLPQPMTPSNHHVDDSARPQPPQNNGAGIEASPFNWNGTP